MLPTIEGVMRQRVLVNYRVDGDLAAAQLPRGLRPRLVAGHAITGICVIQLRQLRPAGLPGVLGLRSTNAAHRTAVEWDAPDGVQQGVYIARRDSDSLATVALGGRLFPGTHRRARFAAADTADRVELHIRSVDGEVEVDVTARVGGDLPESSLFGDLEQVSRFFRDGTLGLSPGRNGHLQALELEAFDWAVTPLAVEHVASSVLARTYGEAAVFDNALLMRGIRHRWHERDAAPAVA